LSCEILLGLHTYSVLVAASVVLSSVCLSHVRSRKLCEIGEKVHRLYRKLGLTSKNMMSDFALEVAKYRKSSPKSQNIQKYRANLLSSSVSDAAFLWLLKVVPVCASMLQNVGLVAMLINVACCLWSFTAGQRPKNDIDMYWL